MKKLLLLLLLLSLPAWATCTSPCIAHVSVFCAGFGSACPTSPINTTGATFCVANVSSFQSTPNVSGIPDNKGNTFTLVTRYQASANSTFETLYYIIAPVVGTGHIWTLANSFTNNATLEVACFNIGEALRVEAGVGGSAAATSAQFGSVTPLTGDLIISGLAVNQGTITSVNSSFNITDQISDGSTVGGGLAYLVAPSGSAVNPTWSWTGSNTWAGDNAVFKLTGAVVTYPTIISVGP